MRILNKFINQCLILKIYLGPVPTVERNKNKIRTLMISLLCSSVYRSKCFFFNKKDDFFDLCKAHTRGRIV